MQLIGFFDPLKYANEVHNSSFLIKELLYAGL